jgi:hypothetical protein
MNRYHVLTLCVALATCTTLSALDWPGPNGPLGNHSVVDPSIGMEWTGAQGKVVWRFPKTGSKTKGEWASCQTTIAQGLIYIVDRNQDNTQAILRVIGLDDGKERWNFPWAIVGAPTSRESRPFGVPTVSASQVFLAGPEDSTLRAVDLKTHAQIWTADFTKLGLVTSGMASPQAVDDFVLIMARIGPDVAVAFDGRTGALRWQTKMPVAGGFRTRTQNSPIAATIHGVRQIIVNHQSGVAGLSLTGDLLWNWDGYKRGTLVAAPSVSLDGYIFVCSGHEGDQGLGHVTHTDGKWTTETVFVGKSKGGGLYPTGREAEFEANRKQFPLPRGNHFTTGAAYWNGYFYIEGMICLGTNGLGVWRGGSTGENPVTVVNGRLLSLAGGDLLVVAADPTGFHELGRIKTGAPSMMLPAYSDGRIVINSVRTGEVVCVDLGIKSKGAPAIMGEEMKQIQTELVIR